MVTFAPSRLTYVAASSWPKAVRSLITFLNRYGLGGGALKSKELMMEEATIVYNSTIDSLLSREISSERVDFYSIASNNHTEMKVPIQYTHAQLKVEVESRGITPTKYIFYRNIWIGSVPDDIGCR